MRTVPSQKSNASQLRAGLALTAFFAFFITLYSWLAIFNAEAVFAPYPAIGTIFSQGFQEGRYDEVKVGMTEVQVVGLLGEPLTRAGLILRLGEGANAGEMPLGSTYMWSYSSDNPRWIWDAAWLGRYVYFNSAGRVTGTLKWVYYD